jgi:hypothetical protein
VCFHEFFLPPFSGNGFIVHDLDAALKIMEVGKKDI